ncbi:type VI secretion system tip protein VgrG [Dyadobacter fermentans]|uniref:Rhs element Vgr protein n=1 Tax=Dyadobacter fermentans (strain ATCC 700827 / DSM 18053 / CIP 107007 / KCTC 52180 / NS114) TaxID=471854 RepID=C6W174_DYAFD|nr:type VI secretion system tip protein VgrG [Dyadobacter fermentans]ACT91931.1 Rhs element Vgr protein [Dyadobacter fermentans DSM 18053]
MSNSRTIATPATPDVCTFTILSEGRELSRTYHVVSIVVMRELNRIPSATITLIDGEAAKETFEISDKDELVPGKNLEIKAGYRSNEETIFKGLVIRHSIKIRKNSNFLIVECRDKAVKATIQPKSKYFTDQTDSEMLEDLLRRNGLERDVQPTAFKHRQLVQYQTTDWDFILQRADVNGLFCAVDNGKVTIKAPDLGQEPVATVQFGSSVLELDAEIDARFQYKTVKNQAWNFTEQTVTEAEAQNPNVRLNGNIPFQDLAKTVDLPSFTFRNGGKLTETELKKQASAELLKSQLSKIRGRVRMQGIAQLSPGKLIGINGVGDRFKGNAFVSAVRHQIANGNWEADVQIGYQAESMNVMNRLAARPERPGGLQVGVVTQLENDPDGEHRVKVRMPLISMNDEGIWARMASLDAGDNRGFFFRPEIGDEVVVGFFDNDPTQAIILGMCHSSAKRAPIAAKDDNHEKGFVSRSQMKMLFDDDKKTINISTPAGNKLIVSEEDQKIQFEDQNGNKIVLDKDGIVIESVKDIRLKAAKDIQLEGVNINAKASAKFSAGAGGGELSTGAGQTTIKGGTVMIN